MPWPQLSYQWREDPYWPYYTHHGITQQHDFYTSLQRLGLRTTVPYVNPDLKSYNYIPHREYNIDHQRHLKPSSVIPEYKTVIDDHRSVKKHQTPRTYKSDLRKCRPWFRDSSRGNPLEHNSTRTYQPQSHSLNHYTAAKQKVSNTTPHSFINRTSLVPLTSDSRREPRPHGFNSIFSRIPKRCYEENVLNELPQRHPHRKRHSDEKITTKARGKKLHASKESLVANNTRDCHSSKFVTKSENQCRNRISNSKSSNSWNKSYLDLHITKTEPATPPPPSSNIHSTSSTKEVNQSINQIKSDVSKKDISGQCFGKKSWLQRHQTALVNDEHRYKNYDSSKKLDVTILRLSKQKELDSIGTNYVSKSNIEDNNSEYVVENSTTASDITNNQYGTRPNGNETQKSSLSKNQHMKKFKENRKIVDNSSENETNIYKPNEIKCEAEETSFTVADQESFVRSYVNDDQSNNDSFIYVENNMWTHKYTHENPQKGDVFYNAKTPPLLRRISQNCEHDETVMNLGNDEEEDLKLSLSLLPQLNNESETNDIHIISEPFIFTTRLEDMHSYGSEMELSLKNNLLHIESESKPTFEQLTIISF